MQLTSWWYWSPLKSCLSLGRTDDWWCLGAGCRLHCPDEEHQEELKTSPIIRATSRFPSVCVRTFEASSLKKFRARLVMWGSGSISSTATSLTWPLTLSTSLSTNWVRTVTAVCLTEGTSSLSLEEERRWGYWLINFSVFYDMKESLQPYYRLWGCTWSNTIIKTLMLSWHKIHNCYCLI